MILLIDNYDSFTWNLVNWARSTARSSPGVTWWWSATTSSRPRRPRISTTSAGPPHVIVSPGPCTPAESGRSRDFLAHFAGRVPIMGVCLGHQCMADRWAMQVVRHPVLMHGKTSEITHDGRGLFEGLSNPFTATRYHSLVVTRETIPTGRDADGNGWEVSATCHDPHGGAEVVMGLRRVWKDASKAPMEGVQFHPESFLTVEGPVLLWNFLRMGAGGRDIPRPEVVPITA
ncbi:MAG: aminodeoxychorismate/anthranilate synthase component II [Phycisphaerales bacterium]